jgi:uncharacterized protein YkwD
MCENSTYLNSETIHARQPWCAVTWIDSQSKERTQFMCRRILLFNLCFAIACAAPLAAQTESSDTSVSSDASPVERPTAVQEETVVEKEVVGEVITGPVEGAVVSYPVESYPVEGIPVEGTTPFQTVSYSSPVIAPMANAALAIVNRKRLRAGLYELQFDPMLTNVAQQKSNIRANRRITGHDGSHKGGARVEGVGHAYGYGDLNSRFNTCYLFSTGYRNAGAAVSYDSSGRAYYTLLLR